MPTLTTNESHNGTWSYEYTNTSSGITTKGNPQVRVASFASRTKTGSWDRAKPVVRPLPPSPYTLTHTRTRSPYVIIKGIKPNSNGQYYERYEGYLYGSYPSTWAHRSYENQLRNEAVLDMLSNLKDQKFNAGVAIAEASGVAKMGYDVLNHLVVVKRRFERGQYHRAFDEYKRRFKARDWSDETGTFLKDWDRFKDLYGNHLTRSQRLSRVPNAWLYYHFGIKPTVTDVQAAHFEWKRRNDNKPENWVNLARGRAKHVIRKEDLVGMGGVLNECLMKFYERQSFRVVVPVVPKNGFLTRMSQLGATNLPEAAWNKLPFSWAVDYFSSFGDWVAALDSGMGWDFGTMVESSRLLREASCSSFANWSNPSVPYGSAHVVIPFRHREFELKRRMPFTFYPPVYSTLPRIKLKGPSSQQWSNLLSVLSGLFNGSLSSQART